MQKDEVKNISLFDYKGRPSWGKSIPLGIQHVLAMIVGNVTPAIMVAAATGILVDERTLLVQTGLLIAGIATFMQIFAFKKIGANLPVIMGASFSYIPVLLAIGQNLESQPFLEHSLLDH